ncbi:hypothetical protein RIF29_31768 [Crotalaria pallida]|uniref:Uncharacterized protein n=1 Tax=Crotalaria pallida TaxID=3830 RepID=A0AAN9EI93_CROPI
MPLFSLRSATERPLRRPPPPPLALSSPSGFTLCPTFFLRLLPPPHSPLRRKSFFLRRQTFLISEPTAPSSNQHAFKP